MRPLLRSELPRQRCFEPGAWLPTLRAQQTLTRESVSLVEVALQRIEGWRKCRTPPLGDPWRPLGVSRRFEDSGTQDQGGYGFPPGPRLFDTARDGRPTDLEGCSRSRTQALLALTCPFRDRIPAAPHRGAASPIRRPGGRLVPVMLPLLGFRALRHTLGPADPQNGSGSLHHRVPRARFGYLLRGFHHRPYRRAKRRSVHGLRPSRRSPRREWCPSRSPCPPDVTGDPTPRGEWHRAAAYRASFPRRVRAATEFPKEPGRRCLPGLFPSRALTPSARAIACSHDASPLALGRDDVPTHLDLRASRIGWLGLVRLRTAGSPGVLHLSTVTALRSPPRGAGSWFHLTQDAALSAAPTAI
jgi:hypothetical protein